MENLIANSRHRIQLYCVDKETQTKKQKKGHRQQRRKEERSLKTPELLHPLSSKERDLWGGGGGSILINSWETGVSSCTTQSLGTCFSRLLRHE